MTTETPVIVYIAKRTARVSVSSQVRLCPPARLGDINCRAVPRGTTCVLIDGLFFHSPAVTHEELLDLLAENRTIIGAGSIGALRAVELRRQGMIGIGSVYQHYLRGKLFDDAEVAEGLSPATFEPLTVSLVRVRRTLAIAQSRGIDQRTLEIALFEAEQIYFLRRFSETLVSRWTDTMPDATVADLKSILEAPESDIKSTDAVAAVRFATGLDGALPNASRVDALFFPRKRL